MKKLLKTSWFWVILVALASIVVLWPFLRPGFFISDDGEWMVIRLSAFYQAFRDGQLPVRFLNRLNFSFGYPVANFLYPGFMYLGSLIHIFGFSFVNTVKIIFVGSVISTAILLFFWLRKKFSNLSSFFGSLSFLFSPYLLFDLYTRGTVGEIFALPAAVLSLYSIELNQPLLLAVSTAWLILAHNSLAVLFIPVIIIYLFLKKRFNLVLYLIFGFAMSCFFWLPAFMERKFVMFDLLSVSNPDMFFKQSNFIIMMGFVNILVYGLSLIILKKRSAVSNFFLIIGIISTIFASSLTISLWHSQFLIKYFQFPFRFLSVGLLASGYLTANLLEVIKQNRKWKIIIVLIILWIFAIPPFFQNIKFVNRSEGYYTTNEATTTVADEYLPRWVSIKPSTRQSSRLNVETGQAQIKIIQSTNRKIEATIVTGTESVIQVNTIYYPGWGIIINGIPVEPDYHNPFGVMRFKIPTGEFHIILEFRETPFRLLSDFISVASLIICIIYFVVTRRKK